MREETLDAYNDEGMTVAHMRRLAFEAQDMAEATSDGVSRHQLANASLSWLQAAEVCQRLDALLALLGEELPK